MLPPIPCIWTGLILFRNADADSLLELRTESVLTSCLPSLARCLVPCRGAGGFRFLLAFSTISKRYGGIRFKNMDAQLLEIHKEIYTVTCCLGFASKYYRSQERVVVQSVTGTLRSRQQHRDGTLVLMPLGCPWKHRRESEEQLGATALPGNSCPWTETSKCLLSHLSRCLVAWRGKEILVLETKYSPFWISVMGAVSLLGFTTCPSSRPSFVLLYSGKDYLLLGRELKYVEEYFYEICWGKGQKSLFLRLILENKWTLMLYWKRTNEFFDKISP